MSSLLLEGGLYGHLNHLYDNPDLSRKLFLYDYYLLSRSLLISKYLNVPIIFLIQIIMIIGLWVFPEAKGKVSIKDVKGE